MEEDDREEPDIGVKRTPRSQGNKGNKKPQIVTPPKPGFFNPVDPPKPVFSNPVDNPLRTAVATAALEATERREQAEAEADEEAGVYFAKKPIDEDEDEELNIQLKTDPNPWNTFDADIPEVVGVMDETYTNIVGRENKFFDTLIEHTPEIFYSDQIDVPEGGSRKNRKMRGGAIGPYQNQLLALPQGRKVVFIIKIISVFTTICVLKDVTGFLIFTITKLIDIFGLSAPMAKMIQVIYDLCLCKAYEAIQEITQGVGRAATSTAFFARSIPRALAEIIYSIASLKILGGAGVMGAAVGLLRGLTLPQIGEHALTLLEGPIIALGILPGQIAGLLTDLKNEIIRGPNIAQRLAGMIRTVPTYRRIIDTLTGPYEYGVETLCSFSLAIYVRYNIIDRTVIIGDVRAQLLAISLYITNCTGLNPTRINDAGLDTLIIAMAVARTTIDVAPMVYGYFVARKLQRQRMQPDQANAHILSIDDYIEQCRMSISIANATRNNLFVIGANRDQTLAQRAHHLAIANNLNDEERILSKLQLLTAESAARIVRTPVQQANADNIRDVITRSKAINIFSAIGSILPQLILPQLNLTVDETFRDFAAPTIPLGGTRIHIDNPENGIDIAVLMIHHPSRVITMLGDPVRFRIPANGTPVHRFISAVYDPGVVDLPVMDQPDVAAVTEYFRPIIIRKLFTHTKRAFAAETAAARAEAETAARAAAAPGGVGAAAAPRGPGGQGAAAPGGGSRKRRKTRRRKHQRRRTRRF